MPYVILVNELISEYFFCGYVKCYSLFREHFELMTKRKNYCAPHRLKKYAFGVEKSNLSGRGHLSGDCAGANKPKPQPPALGDSIRVTSALIISPLQNPGSPPIAILKGKDVHQMVNDPAANI